MQFGYIKINGKISQIFTDKTDIDIQVKVNKLRSDLDELNIMVEWDNFRTNKSLDDLEEFMKSEKTSY